MKALSEWLKVAAAVVGLACIWGAALVFCVGMPVAIVALTLRWVGVIP